MAVRKIENGRLILFDKNESEVLSIEEKCKDGVLSIILSGEIKNDVAHEFEDELMAAITVSRNIVLDFSGVTYIASLSLKTLLSAQQIIDEIEDAEMILINVTEEVMKIFNESGFSEILLIKKVK